MPQKTVHYFLPYKSAKKFTTKSKTLQRGKSKKTHEEYEKQKETKSIHLYRSKLAQFNSQCTQILYYNDNSHSNRSDTEQWQTIVTKHCEKKV